MKQFTASVDQLVLEKTNHYLEQKHSFQVLKARCLAQEAVPEILNDIETELTQAMQTEYDDFNTQTTQQFFQDQIREDIETAELDDYASSDDIRQANELRETLTRRTRELDSIRETIQSLNPEITHLVEEMNSLNRKIRTKKETYYNLLSNHFSSEYQSFQLKIASRERELSSSVTHGHPAPRANPYAPSTASVISSRSLSANHHGHPAAAAAQANSFSPATIAIATTAPMPNQLTSIHGHPSYSLQNDSVLQDYRAQAKSLREHQTSVTRWLHKLTTNNLLYSENITPEPFDDIYSPTLDGAQRVLKAEIHILSKNHQLLFSQHTTATDKLGKLIDKSNRLTKEISEIKTKLEQEIPRQAAARSQRQRERDVRRQIRTQDNASLLQLSDPNRNNLKGELEKKRRELGAEKPQLLEQAKKLSYSIFINQLISKHQALPAITEETAQRNILQIAELIKQALNNTKQQQSTKQRLTAAERELKETQSVLRKKQQEIGQSEYSMQAKQQAINIKEQEVTQINNNILQRRGTTKKAFILGCIAFAIGVAAFFTPLAIIEAPLLAIITSLWMIPALVTAVTSAVAFITSLCLKIRSTLDEYKIDGLRYDITAYQGDIQSAQRGTNDLNKTIIPELNAKENQQSTRVSELTHELSQLLSQEKSYYDNARLINESPLIASSSYGNVAMFPASAPARSQRPPAINPDVTALLVGGVDDDSNNDDYSTYNIQPVKDAFLGARGL